MRDQERGKRLIALFLLGLVAINFPLLAVAEAGTDAVRAAAAVRLPVRRLGRPDPAARPDRRGPALRCSRARSSCWSRAPTSARCSDRLHRRPPRRAGPQHHQQPLHLHAQHRGLLHRLDLLRQRRPRRRRRHRLPADLSRPDAHGLPVVVRAAQDAAHHQGLRHHLDRRLRRLALRQERAARRPGHDRRGVRHHALHLAPAEGGLDQRRGDPRLPRPGAVLARPRALRGAAPGRVQHPVRHPAHRRHRAPPGHGRGDRVRIDRQAGRLRHRRRCTSPTASTTASATSSTRRSTPASAPS